MTLVGRQGRNAFNITAEISHDAPFGESRPCTHKSPCPLCPQKRQQSGHWKTAASCHKQTHAPQQFEALFDYLVGAQQC
jgi:hypothetical protein